MKKLFVVLFIFAAAMAWAQKSPVAVGNDGKSWTLTTNSFVYQIRVSDQGTVNMYYFGDKSQDLNMLHDPLGEEVTVRGGYSATTPMLEAIFKDRVRDIELTYAGSEIQVQDGYTVLAIHQKDQYYPLAVTEYIRVLPEYDLLEKWVEITNTGKKGDIELENAQSGTFFLPKNAYELTHLSGRWGYEYQPNVTKLTQGLKTLQTKDLRSYGSSFFAIRPEGEQEETCGEVWFGTLQYSGNWRVDLEKFAPGELQTTCGINFWDQSLVLKPGKSFTTPKMIIGYSARGMEGASQSLASYTREKVLYPSHRDQVRPVLYNSWYATTFDVNEEHQLALAKIAKELGVEIFVIDDGWFKGRVDDKGGLGDWTVDKKKFPNGLQPMIEKINDLGLDFGIWIEPEMVNPNSDLYRRHPDWVFHYPNRTRHETRNQLMLNLAREDVYQYLYTSFSTLLRENNIKFIKWDMNRGVTEPGFLSAPTDEQRAVRIKYVENLYRLLETLRSEFPDVWFENCAGGGGRVDLGMMARTDFCWASDNTDPVERIFIQHSFLNVFPSNSMISWVTQEDWHNQNHPLEFKFDVSMCGVLGVGYDITKWGDKEKEVAREKVARYKEIRETVHKGDHYRLVSPYENNRSVLQFVNKPKSESIVFVYNLAEYPNNAIPETKRPKSVKLRGLQPDASYQIEGVKGVYKGSQLMNIGIEFPLYGAFKSRIFKIVKL
ncbi:alpha-galactosidase [Parabacteroides leei]|uniref:alpha-galactosidase n=1 Tax=Parabacteroides leei TaxID=2939491 RepID=UPI00189B8B8B|nr:MULTISPECIES: alpha-galactosidase [Parabacteroides]MCL3853907.1 alpha-galactosidase [Parabacteroides leei]